MQTIAIWYRHYSILRGELDLRIPRIRPEEYRLHLMVAVAAVIAGCAVGPSFQRPASPQVKGYTPEPLPAQTAAAKTAGAVCAGNGSGV